MPTPFTRRLTGLVGALVLGSVSAPVALAQDTTPDTPTMLVLDSSGSMINNDAGGQTRIDAAKDAAGTFIDKVGDSADLGLVTYGGNTGETDAEREAGCRDITLVTAPGDDTADDMLDHIDSLEPRGFTPIGDSLIEAADALPSQGGTIVLVSDGIDTCAPPPVCEVAADLADRGVDIVINTVGFNVDAAARAELQCIADAAGGTYADASDADTLAEELKKASTRTYRAYQSDLQRIDGGTVSQPAEIERAIGEFSTSLPSLPKSSNLAESSEVYYRLPVAKGERLIISSQTTQPPSLDNWDTGSFLFSPSLEESGCTLEYQPGSDIAVEGHKTAAVYTREIGAGRCDVDHVTIVLQRKGNWRHNEDIDVDVEVTRLGKPDLTGVPDPAEEPSDPPVVSPAGEPADATPGSWFTDATELEPGQPVRADIVPGETHFFRIPVAHGQRLTGRAATLEESNRFEDNGPGDRLMLHAYNTARAEVPLNHNQVGATQPTAVDFGYEAPILFTNRYGGTDGEGSGSLKTENVWLDGDQFLTVQYGKLFSKEQIDAQTQLPTLTYELVADAVGDLVNGPTFTDVAPGTEASTPASASAEPESEPVADTDPEAAAAEDSDSGNMGLWLGLGALALVIAGAAAFAVTRRR